MTISMLVGSKRSRGDMKNFLGLIVLMIIMVALPYFYWMNLNSPLNPNGKVKVFVVQKGEAIDSIANRLQNEGFIRSALMFRLYLRNSGLARQIQAGDFKLSPAMNLDEIAQTMSEGSLDKWVTLIEGWRDEEMAKELLTVYGIPTTAFLQIAREGYMFPDTYLINKDATVADVVSILRNTFDQRYSDDLQAKVRANGLTADQGVILASIVEREARSDEVRQKVASILLKRFKIGMGLEADATVQYAKDSRELGALSDEQKLKFKFWQPVTSDDYRNVVSPFNTYLHAGLPPSPICNPSFSSLKAVTNADSSTPYLYYYHDSKGNSYYAKTLDEHNENVAKYH